MPFNFAHGQPTCKALYRVLQNLCNKIQSEIVMIKLYCCGPDYCSMYPLLNYFFQIRNGLGSWVFKLCCKDLAKPCILGLPTNRQLSTITGLDYWTGLLDRSVLPQNSYLWFETPCIFIPDTGCMMIIWRELQTTLLVDLFFRGSTSNHAVALSNSAIYKGGNCHSMHHACPTQC